MWGGGASPCMYTQRTHDARAAVYAIATTCDPRQRTVYAWLKHSKRQCAARCHRWRECMARSGRPSRQSALWRSSYSDIGNGKRMTASTGGSSPNHQKTILDASIARGSWSQIPTGQVGTCIGARVMRMVYITGHNNRSSINMGSQSSASTSPTKSIMILVTGIG